MEASNVYFKEALDSFKAEIDRLDYQATLDLANQILDNNRIFRYLPVIGYLLKKTAALDDRFFVTLKKAIEKTNGDMAQPTLVNDLIEVGRNNTELGFAIYNKARELHDNGLVFASRCIFAGVGIKKYDLIRGIIEEDLKANTTELCISAISIIRVVFSTEIENSIKDHIFTLLDTKQTDTDQRVRSELVYTYIVFYKYDPELCFDRIISLCKKDLQLSGHTLGLLHLPNLSKEHYLKLIEFLSDSEDREILNHVLMSFHDWAKEELIDFELGIVLKLLKRFSFYGISSLSEALNEIGKADLNKSIDFVFCILDSDSSKLRFYSPMVAVALANQDFGKLVASFQTILQDPKREWFLFETSRRLLQQIYERSGDGKNLSQTDGKTVDDLLCKLKTLARTKGLNSEIIANRESLSVYKCLVLIEVMNKAQKIDFSVIRRNVDQFPNIKEFLGQKWFNKMEQEQNTTHPLLVFLADPLLDQNEVERKKSEMKALGGTNGKMQELSIADSMRNRSLLQHLEDAIGKIRNNQFLRNMKDALRQEEQFWKVFSEIDVRSRLAQDFNLSIGPPLEIIEDGKNKTKHPDFGLTFEGKDIYLEVISPEMFPPLRYFHNAGIPNRVRHKITDEIKHHFKGMLIPKDVIIIVDLASSELRYESIQNYVDGELQFVFRMNTKTREPEGVFTQRGEPMTKVDPETQIVVGIIGYSRIIGTDGRIHLKGRIFRNENALNKSKVLQAISQKLLG